MRLILLPLVAALAAFCFNECSAAWLNSVKTPEVNSWSDANDDAKLEKRGVSSSGLSAGLNAVYGDYKDGYEHRKGDYKEHKDNYKYDHKEHKYGYKEHKYDYKEPKNDYKEQKDDYKEHKYDYKEPKDDSKEPKDDYKEPKDDYKEPKDDYKEPKDDYKEPKDYYKEPKDDYKEPKDYYKEPKDDYKEPKDDYKEPKDDYKVNLKNNKLNYNDDDEDLGSYKIDKSDNDELYFDGYLDEQEEPSRQKYNNLYWKMPNYSYSLTDESDSEPAEVAGEEVTVEEFDKYGKAHLIKHYAIDSKGHKKLLFSAEKDSDGKYKY